MLLSRSDRSSAVEPGWRPWAERVKDNRPSAVKITYPVGWSPIGAKVSLFSCTSTTYDTRLHTP